MFALVKDDEPIFHALLDSQSGKENIDQYIERYLNDIGKDAVKDAVTDATTDTVVGRVTSEVTKMFPNISFDDTNGMEKEDDLLNDKWMRLKNRTYSTCFFDNLAISWNRYYNINIIKFKE